MKRILAFFGLIFLMMTLLTVAGIVFAFKQWQSGNFSFPSTDTKQDVVEIDHPQLGIFNIPFSETSASWMKSNVVLTDLKNVGVDAVGGVGVADLTWANVEPQKGQWDFSRADEMFNQDDVEVVADVFGDGRISSAAPWEEGIQPHLTDDAKAYLLAVIDRYGDRVRYWQLGSNLTAWRTVAEDGTATWDFTPQEQGAFLAEAAGFIREHDKGAVIVMPALTALDTVNLDEWLPGVLEAGTWFDIVNYRYIGDWKAFGGRHDVLRASLAIQGLQSLPVWLTGIRPLSIDVDADQASILSTLVVQAYGYGDQFVAWDGYVDQLAEDGSVAQPGLRTVNGEMQPMLAALGFISHELMPFVSVEQEAHSLSGTNVYRFTLADGEERLVAWGAGTFTVPEGFDDYFFMAPLSGVSFEQHSVREDRQIELHSVPILMK